MTSSKKVMRLVHVPRYWVLFLFILGVAYFGWTQVTKTRGAQTVDFQASSQKCASSGPLKYCIHEAQTGSSKDVVYHLHGRNLDELIWNDDTYYTALVQSEWQRSRAKPPTVVTISYGPTWLLAPKGERPDSGLLEDFIGRLPEIEKKLGTPRRRLLLGESMGGLNALVAGLTYPDQFEKIAALCPGVYDISPFASFAEMRAVAEQTGADPKVAFGIWQLVQDYVADENEWRRLSPLLLIEKSNAEYPALYLSNGLYDGFGNFAGTEKLARVAETRGVEVEWRPLYGGHCSIDVSSLATFLISD